MPFTNTEIFGISCRASAVVVAGALLWNFSVAIAIMLVVLGVGSQALEIATRPVSG